MAITNLDFIDRLKKRIMNHEGFRLKPYHLSYGNVTESFATGGYGHRILPDEEIPTTEEGWRKVFDADFNIAFEGATRICQDMNLPDEKFGVFVELAYQIGVNGLSKFRKTLQHAKDQNWDLCANELLDSKLHKQTPNRLEFLADVMRGKNNE